MNFKCIIENQLWSVRYDDQDECDDALRALFNQCTDTEFLFGFFSENEDDLKRLSRHIDVETAVARTIREAELIEEVLLDLSSESNLDTIFRPLDNYNTHEAVLSKEKGRLKEGRHVNSPSWLRIYALRLSNGQYLITGGAIKLTKGMKERKHTLEEFNKMGKVRDFLQEKGIVDTAGFVEYIEQQKE